LVKLVDSGDPTDPDPVFAISYLVEKAPDTQFAAIQCVHVVLHYCMVLYIIWFCRLTSFCMDTLALLESKDLAFKNNLLCERCSAGITWAFEAGSGRMQEHDPYDIKWPHKAVSSLK